MHQLDIHPDGNVVIGGGYPSPEISFDGISFSLKASDSDDFGDLIGTSGNSDLLSTAADVQWEQPGYTMENRRVFLRGLVGRTATSGSFMDGTLLGVVPVTMRPSHTHSFPAIAHSGNNVQHIIVTPGGEVVLRKTFPGATLVSLDDVSWPARLTHLWMAAWTIVSTSGRELQFQANQRLHACAVIQDSGAILVAGVAGAVSFEWRHNPDNLNTGVVAIGQWLMGMKDVNNFVISHRDQTSNESVPLLIRSDGTWCTSEGKRSAVVTGFALDPRSVNTARIGDWVYGEHQQGCFIIQRVGAVLPSLVS